jgi:hypothetical protein
MDVEATEEFLRYFFQGYNTDPTLPLHESDLFIRFVLNKIKDMEQMEIIYYLDENFMKDGEFSLYKFCSYTFDIMGCTIIRNNNKD